MDWFNLAMDLLVPLIMIGIGLGFLKKPPKDINGAYGYRTPMSMKNQDTWDFAHRVCGRVWCIVGCAMLPLSALAWWRTLPYSEGNRGFLTAAATALEAVVMLLTIIPVEWALYKAFDKNGARREP